MKLDGPKKVVYIDGIYEKDLDSGVVTKYYFAGGSRVAMRTGGTLRYLASDHLGSTAFVMNASGALESHVRYHPYGMTWSQTATPATDRLFTGHQQMGAKSGTYYANARFYSADIGRFPQPDSILPNVYDPQELLRPLFVDASRADECYTSPTVDALVSARKSVITSITASSWSWCTQ